MPSWTGCAGAAMELSDEVLVVLVADMITEEALPSYAVSLNRWPKTLTAPATGPGHGGAGLDGQRKTGTGTCSTPTSA